MPTSGAYEFKLAEAAQGGVVEDAHLLKPGEWAWVWKSVAESRDFLAVYACCPDCTHPMTLWRRFNKQIHGHQLDKQGNIHPSVLHSYKVDGQEQCGFHTIPTKLLNFVDLR